MSQLSSNTLLKYFYKDPDFYDSLIETYIETVQKTVVTCFTELLKYKLKENFFLKKEELTEQIKAKDNTYNDILDFSLYEEQKEIYEKSFFGVICINTDDNKVFIIRLFKNNLGVCQLDYISNDSSESVSLVLNTVSTLLGNSYLLSSCVLYNTLQHPLVFTEL